MRWTIPKAVAIGFLFSLVLLITVSCLLYFSVQEQTRLANQVRHTQQVLLTLENIMSDLKDKENGQRGYLLTGNTRYLTPYLVATDNIKQTFRTLRRLTSDNLPQQERLAELRRLAAQRELIIQQTIALQKSGQYQDAIDMVKSNAGIKVMLKIRALISEMQEAEHVLLEKRYKAMYEKTNQTFIFLVLGSILSVFLMIVFYRLIVREMNYRQSAEEQLLLTNQHLESLVTERTRDIEQERKSLQESEARFKSMADLSPALIWMTDPSESGKIIYYNQSFLDFLGKTFEEAKETGWQSTIHADDLNYVNKTYRQGVAQHRAYTMECRVRRHDGIYRWLLVSCVPRMDGDNQFLGYIGSCIDLTEVKKNRQELEAQVAERTYELQKNRDLLDSIIENVPAMIFMKSVPDFRFILLNKATEELTGYTRQELLGKNDYDFFPVEQAGFFVEQDSKTIQAKTLVDIREEFITTRSGEIRCLHTKKVPILDMHGEPQFLLGISEDITEARKNKESIETLNHKLEEQVQALNIVNKELEAFSYSVSHDLRAPLRTIDGFSQAVLEIYLDKLDDRGKDYLRRIRTGSQQMGQLIDDMLKLSRLNRGELKIEDDISLSDMAQEILTNLASQEPERKVSCQIDENLLVRGDKRLLQAVMENLLNNAWKYTSKKEQANIEVGQLTNETPIYYVSDDGAGFDMAYSDKLFGAFQRLHSSNEFAGTGVGLATVARIIHRHGGEVWAEGEVDKGATFYFTLNPINEEEKQDAKASKSYSFS